MSSSSAQSCSNDGTNFGKTGSKFKATVLWYNLVYYIKRNVKQKKRRLLLKGVGPTDCFSGSDLCDTVLLYLLMDNENFKTTDLTREKSAKLCQMLLEQQVIEPLSGSGSTSDKRFEDTSNKYYKFTSTDADNEGKTEVTKRKQDAQLLPRPDEKMKIRENRQPELLEGVISNPGTEFVDPDVDCDSNQVNTVQELMGLKHDNRTRYSASVNPKKPLGDICSTYHTDKNVSIRQNVKRAYKGHIRSHSHRTSLDCEAIMSRNKIPRLLSTHISTPGSYRIKTSAPDLSSLINDEESQHTAALNNYNLRRQRTSLATFDDDLQLCTEQPSRLDKRGRSYDGDVFVNKSASRTVEKIAKLTGDTIFSPAAISDMRQEIALSQLSQLVELPVLEGLLNAHTQSKEEPGYDNSVFFDVTQQHNLGLNTTDAWISSAIELFDHIPNGHKITFDYYVGHSIDDYKLTLYRSILKSYRSRPDPLLPLSHEPIHIAALNLVMSGLEKKAVLVLRLAAVLLPCYVVAEVSALLTFLQTVSLCNGPKIRANQNNTEVMLNEFAGIFFMGCKKLNMDQRRILLLLLTRFHLQISKIPQSVEQALESSIQGLKNGSDVPVLCRTYCSKMTTGQFEQQSEQFTEAAIVELVRRVLDDTSMPLKNKQKQIKQFQKHHPLIMSKHFSDMQ